MKKFITTILIFICFNANAQCDKIKKGYNELTGEEIITSPRQSDYNYISGSYNLTGTLQIQKITKNANTNTFIIFGGSGSTSLIGSKGLYIKLSNGHVLRFDDFDVSSMYVSNGQHHYTCFFTLSKEYEKLFLENKIESYQIGVYKYEPKNKDSENFKKYIDCILNNY